MLRTKQFDSGIPSFNPFFYNLDVYLDIPDELHQLSLSQDWGGIKRLITSELVTFDRFISYLFSIIEIELIQRELFETSGQNIIELIFKIFSDKEFSDKFEIFRNNPNYSVFRDMILSSHSLNIVKNIDIKNAINLAKILEKHDELHF